MMATLMNVVSIIALILVLNSYQIKNVFGYPMNNETIVIFTEPDESERPLHLLATPDHSNETVTLSVNHTLQQHHTNETLAKDRIEMENGTDSSSTTEKSTTEAPSSTTSNPEQMLIPPAEVNASIAQLPSTTAHKHKQGQIIIR